MNRTCRNPILGGFYPDPSICRVGGGNTPPNFYLVNSTFAYFPGIPIFHSMDLLHWKQIGNAIDRPGQLNFDGHQISEGLFAPTIRHHQGTFYILCTLIRGGGNFIITAKDPAGPWSDPIWLSGAEGIDPSIFFDTDGKVWYIGTHAAPDAAYPGDNEIYIQEMDMGLLNAGKNPLLGESLGVWRGALRNAAWPEGPHIYRIGGWYYLLYAEGGTGRDHAVCIARAQNIRGPWEGKQGNPILTHRYLGTNAEIVNTGHADIVDDADGNWWMVLLASRTLNGVCPLGRETFLAAIAWKDDWPWINSPTGMVEKEFPLPSLTDETAAPSLEGEWSHESACDHFSGTLQGNLQGKLPLHWLTLRMPARAEDAAFSLTDRPGVLRLFTRAATMRGREHPAFAGRRLRHKNWAFSAAIEFTPKTEKESAGIILLQSEDWHYRFELYLAASGSPFLRLVRAAGKEDEIIFGAQAPESASPLVLAACCYETEISFFYGRDQYSLQLFKGPVDGRILSTEYAGGFVGTLAGVCASGNGKDIDNYADVLWAEYKGLD